MGKAQSCHQQKGVTFYWPKARVANGVWAHGDNIRSSQKAEVHSGGKDKWRRCKKTEEQSFSHREQKSQPLAHLYKNMKQSVMWSALPLPPTPSIADQHLGFTSPCACCTSMIHSFSLGIASHPCSQQELLLLVTPSKSGSKLLLESSWNRPCWQRKKNRFWDEKNPYTITLVIASQNSTLCPGLLWARQGTNTEWNIAMSQRLTILWA